MAASKKPRRKKVQLKPTQLTATELLLSETHPLAAEVERSGGQILSHYREPIGGRALLLVALPIELVNPTPFQRDVSPPHVAKLTRAMDKTKRFLDPIIVVKSERGYETPNGAHRLTALKELGAKSVVALFVPEPEVAFHILALNIEKAHNLRERALEVVRMYRELAPVVERKENDFELEFEEPALITLGFAYEQRGRLAGGAYHPILRKVDEFFAVSLEKAASKREARAALVIAFDDAVNAAVAKLKARGLQSPYLKNFVVARVNPLRFIKGDPPPLEELFTSMTARVGKIKVDSIKNEDVVRSGGAPSED